MKNSKVIFAGDISRKGRILIDAQDSTSGYELIVLPHQHEECLLEAFTLHKRLHEEVQNRHLLPSHVLKFSQEQGLP